MPGDVGGKVSLREVLKGLQQVEGSAAPSGELVNGVFRMLDLAASFSLPKDASPRDAELVSRLDRLYGALRRVRLVLIRRESEAEMALRRTTAAYEGCARGLRRDDDVVRSGTNKEEREALLLIALEKRGYLTKMADAEDAREAWTVLGEGVRKATARLEFARKVLGLLAGRGDMG